MSALLQLHLHSRLNTWLQWTGHRQLHDETRNIEVLGFVATYTRGLTVVSVWMVIFIYLQKRGKHLDMMEGVLEHILNEKWRIYGKFRWVKTASPIVFIYDEGWSWDRMAGSVGLPRWSPSYFERKGFHNPPFPWLLITASWNVIDKGDNGIDKVNFGWDNDSSGRPRQAITWTNVDVLQLNPW